MSVNSLHVRTIISHFVEIGEVLNIETWHKGRLLLLESIVSEVKCDKLAEKIISPFECASGAAKVQVCSPRTDAIVFITLLLSPIMPIVPPIQAVFSG